MQIDQYTQELVDLNRKKTELRKSLDISTTDSIVDVAYLMRDIDVRIQEIKEKLLINQQKFIIDKKVSIKSRDALLLADKEERDHRQYQRDQRLKMLRRFKKSQKHQSQQLQAWRGAAVGSLTVIAAAILLYLFFII